MSNIFQDKYVLGQSQSGTVASIGQEIRLDLQLNPNTNTLTGGNVSGTVKDSSGNPIPNSLVKIMDANYAPLMHDITDATGVYNFTNVPANQTYNIFATASGMTLNQGNQFTVSSYQDLTINFTMTSDSAMTLGVIAGDLLDQSNNQPISGAVVSLYLINADGTQTIKAITYTNQYGQYTFREVPQGNYSVEISGLGYNSTSVNITINQTGQLVPMTVTMVQDPNTSRGTVSGIITDNNNQPINRADVILYKVNANNTLTPVAFTKTTTSGIYLFTNVDPGSYKVKSNQSQVVNVTVNMNYSPYFDTFVISSYSSLWANAINGTPSNGAKLEHYGQMMGWIGGPSNGQVIVPITVTTAGNYIMGIQYNSPGTSNKPLKIKVNSSTTPQVITITPTASWSVADNTTISVPVTLVSGTNNITFYNDTGVYTCDIGLLTFAQVKDISATTGTLSNGATLQLNNQFVGGIGTNGGNVTVNLNAPISGRYTLGIQYLSGDAITPVMIDIDGVNTGTVYSFPKTNTWTLADVSVLNTTINLMAGANIINFYNSQNNSGPWIGMLTITPIIEQTSYRASNGVLEGSATITNGFVTGIQSNNGAVTINATVPSVGIYNCIINYVAGDNFKQCNISVNGTSTGTTYTFSKTSGMSSYYDLPKRVQLTLNTGVNAIKFYNQ